MATFATRASHWSRIKRELEIVRALSRHGLGWLVTSLGIGAAFPFHYGLLGHPKRAERYSAPEHLRMAFEDLGTTFIKLGQILSTRPDLVSPAYADELSRLQDDCPALSFEDMEVVLKEELGEDYSKRFRRLDDVPLGSASIAQVYGATLQDGQRVVVKVQRPGVADAIALDLEILDRFARRIARKSDWGQRYDLPGFVSEFAFSLRNEIDYKYEAENAERIGHTHESNPSIVIPRIHREHSTSRVLVMDELRGTKVKHVDSLSSLKPEQRRRLAEAATDITMKQIFEAGFFHADPHPGNFVILEDKRIGLMDFGLVGTLSDSYRETFLRFTYQMVKRDAEGMLDALWDLGITQVHAERPAIQRDLNHVLYRFKESSAGELAAGDLLGELMNVAYRHQMPFPANLSLLFKVLSMNEGVAAMLDPDFKFFDYIEPRLRELWKTFYSPSNFAKKLERDTVHVVQLLQGLPHRVERLIQRLETGDLQFNVRSQHTERESERIYSAINRLTVGATLGLLTVGLGLYIVAVEASPTDSGGVNWLFGGVVLTGAALGVNLLMIWTRRRP